MRHLIVQQRLLHPQLYAVPFPIAVFAPTLVVVAGVTVNVGLVRLMDLHRQLRHMLALSEAGSGFLMQPCAIHVNHTQTVLHARRYPRVAGAMVRAALARSTAPVVRHLYRVSME